MTHLYEALQRHTVLGAQILVSGIGDVVRLTPCNLRLRGSAHYLNTNCSNNRTTKRQIP